MSLENRISTGEAKVCIIGMGYVGLPLARAFTGKGIRVVGFDIDPAKVEALNKGRSYLKTVPAEVVERMRREGRFEATADASRFSECDAIIICVPTPLTEAKEPDLSYVEASARQIAEHLREGQIVVLESTTWPGTTEEIIRPILEKTGLKCGKDFHLAFSPEREDPGNASFTTETTPKVVGGSDEESTRLASMLYARAIQTVVPVGGTREAEAAKILENVYRSVNIALINELKVIFDRMGIDVWEVIQAAKTKPFGFQAFYPGPGLGGHCIPIDPFYLAWKARQYDCYTRFIELAGEINTSMPYFVVNKVAEALNSQRKAVNGSKVLVLGLAYKKDIDDVRESPSMVLIELLRERGAEVLYNDPLVPSTHPMRHHDLGMTSRELTPELLRSVDCVLVATDHSAYDWGMVCREASLVVDTRNATAGVAAPEGRIWKA
jgi:UDP-N-acetyl-D-glucosamine dehydrogenase